MFWYIPPLILANKILLTYCGKHCFYRQIRKHHRRFRAGGKQYGVRATLAS